MTHFVGCAPLVVTEVIKLSSSSLFSLSFFTRLSIARLLKLSDSPPYNFQDKTSFVYFSSGNVCPNKQELSNTSSIFKIKESLDILVKYLCKEDHQNYTRISGISYQYWIPPKVKAKISMKFDSQVVETHSSLNCRRDLDH